MSERTRAILPVHIAGHPAEMAKVMAFARQHNLKVVEDAAHALEAGVGDGARGRVGEKGKGRKG